MGATFQAAHRKAGIDRPAAHNRICCHDRAATQFTFLTLLFQVGER
jgi:hypothetical protein